jgi:hypothetical protein
MKPWMKFAIPVAAIVIAVVAGTAAYAMRDGSGDDSPPSAAADEARDDDGNRAAGSQLSQICAAPEDGVEGQPECNDTIDGGQATDGFENCAADACDEPQLACPPDSACFEPWLMDPPSCPPGVLAEECERLIEPAGAYECVTLESDPPQTRCTFLGCEAAANPDECLKRCEELPVEILPAPADGVETAPTILPGFEPATPVCAPPPTDPCPSDTVRCLPPDCAVSSDGAVACPEPCAPDSEGGCGELPPECTEDPNGGVSCPGAPPISDPDCPADPTVLCAAPEPGVAEGGGSSGQGVDVIDPAR